MKRPFLRLRIAPVLAFATATIALSGRADDVAVFRIVDEGSLRVSAARATRGVGSGVTVVVVLETPRGDRLVLRRAPAEDGTTVYEAGFGGPSAVKFTRRGDVLLLQAGGRSLSLAEADISRPTVRCWVSTLLSRADPKFLDAVSGVRLLKDAAAGPALDDVYTPLQLLWLAAEPSDVRVRVSAKLEKGPFTGETWDRLRRAASDEIGRR
jgi:hypothetical protein